MPTRRRAARLFAASMAAALLPGSVIFAQSIKNKQVARGTRTGEDDDFAKAVKGGPPARSSAVRRWIIRPRWPGCPRRRTYLATTSVSRRS